MKKPLFCSVLLLGAVATASAHAAGYFTGNRGAHASGRAGAFVAKADDLSAVMYNPAGLSRIGTTLIHVGNRFSYNQHTFTRAPTNDTLIDDFGNPVPVRFAQVENQQPWQLLDPMLGVATNFGLEGWGFALAAYAPPGVARYQYPLNGGQRYMMVEREVMMINYAASAAWQWKDVFGLGLSLQAIAVPKVRYQLVVDATVFRAAANPVSSTLDMLATVEGSDLFTPSAIVGGWVRPLPFLEFGLSGQIIPADIVAASTLQIERVEGSGDVELLREGQPANDVTLRLPLPLTARAGVRYIHLRGEKELFDIELGAVYESWSRVDRFTMNSGGLMGVLPSVGVDLDVGVIPVEKQWQDTITLQLGGDVEVIPDRLTLRAGAYYETAVARRSHAHVDFPVGAALGGALGLSVFLGQLELGVAYEYRHQPTVAVSEAEGRVYQEVPGSTCQPPYTGPDCHPAYQGQPSPVVNGGTYDAYSHAATLDALYRF